MEDRERSKEELILELKNMRDKVDKLEDELKLQNKYSSVIVHDLRSPITAIKMANDTMMEEGEGLDFDMKLMFMSTIDNESNRMLSLVNNLLDLYKLKSGDFDVDKKPTDLADVIATSYGALNNIAADKSISLKLEIDNKISVAGDFRRLQQVIFNILSNAIKFTPDGGDVIIRSKLNEDEVIVSCIDSGVGIPQEEIPLIFKEFKQLSSRATSGEKGTGLGMTITKKIIEAHGGSIWVESELNKGTTVNFKLPLLNGSV